MAQKAGGEDALKGMFKDMLQPLSNAPDSAWDDNDNGEMDAALDDVDMEARDLAAETAQHFVELLADGDFIGAKTLLGSSLAAVSARDLREEYENMVVLGREIAAEEGDDIASPLDEIEVFVQSVEDELLEEYDEVLGRAYVVVNGPDFDEAVTVVVAREEGEPRIQELEWGRHWPAATSTETGRLEPLASVPPSGLARPGAPENLSADSPARTHCWPAPPKQYLQRPAAPSARWAAGAPRLARRRG